LRPGQAPCRRADFDPVDTFAGAAHGLPVEPHTETQIACIRQPYGRGFQRRDEPSTLERGPRQARSARLSGLCGWSASKTRSRRRAIRRCCRSGGGVGTARPACQHPSRRAAGCRRCSSRGLAISHARQTCASGWTLRRERRRTRALLRLETTSTTKPEPTLKVAQIEELKRL
jgi:hypothetical protein